VRLNNIALKPLAANGAGTVGAGSGSHADPVPTAQELIQKWWDSGSTVRKSRAFIPDIEAGRSGCQHAHRGQIAKVDVAISTAPSSQR